jgi:hypothetical protein
MSGHGEKLPRKQEVAISALLTCPSLGEAARRAKIGEYTLRRWLQDADFTEAYRQARRQVVQSAIVQIQVACGEAVQTLRVIMGNADAPASARVSAARTVLEMAVKAVELEDLEQRLTALEAHMTGKPMG